MSEELTQHQIVCGLRQGDRGAWSALCERYSSAVWRYVARLVGRDETAVADVFQETMLAVARSGRSLANDAKLWPWLARIAHNQVALYWRKHYRDRTLSLENATAAPAADADPSAALARVETVVAVRRLLAEMDAAHVALLTAKYLDGQTVVQIVESQGGTTESVRSRLARARADFRRRYERLLNQADAVKTSSAAERSPHEGDP